MKKLLFFIILFTSILLAGELEVDGDLKVTGTVESTTIDSLKSVIAELQSQYNNFPYIHRKKFEIPNSIDTENGTYVQNFDFIVPVNSLIIGVYVKARMTVGNGVESGHGGGISLNISGINLGTQYLSSVNNIIDNEQYDNSFSFQTQWSDEWNADLLRVKNMWGLKRYAISSLVPLKLLDENNTLSIKLKTAYSGYIVYAEKILIEILYIPQFIEDD